MPAMAARGHNFELFPSAEFFSEAARSQVPPALRVSRVRLAAASIFRKEDPGHRLME
jgi:hypothetical protein